MELKDLRFAIVFSILLALEIIGEVYEILPLIYIFKPLLGISLIYKIRSENTRHTAVQNIATFGFLAATAGDVFLMIRGGDFFIYGLGMFLIAQLAIGLGFWYWNRPRQKPAPFFDIILTFPFFVFYVINMIYLTNLLRSENLTEMINPLWIYGGAITFMGIAAVTRYNRADKNSYFWGIIGAVLFIISDTIIAYNRFSEPIEYASFFVMLTYGMAIYFIAMSFVNFMRYRQAADGGSGE